MQPDRPASREIRHNLEDLFAYQCVLVTLRGIGPDASEEMIWQTFLGAVVAHYALRSAWYARCDGDSVRPIAHAGAEDDAPRDSVLPLNRAPGALGRAIASGLPAVGDNCVALPLAIDGTLEGCVILQAGAVPADRIHRLNTLVAEAAALLGERRSKARLERALRESEQKYRALVQSTVDWVWQLDRDGRFSYSSARVRDLLGADPEQVLRRRPEEILPHEAAERFWSALRLRQRCCAIPLRLPDGREVFAEVQSAPWDGGWIGTCRDVTERVRAQQALEAAKEQAEAANRSKTQFLAAMSHEIRTPMNGVIGMTSLLAETDLNSEQRDCVDTIRASGQALLSLIDDILDLSKIEAGRLELESRPFRLRDCVEKALELVAAAAAAKRLELACRFAPEVPEIVAGDEARLRQVLLNLLGNAVKFTRSGEVIVSVESRAAAGGHELRFAVRDTGIGIPADRIGRLFQPFCQADASTTRRFGGTGLGLAISRRLVENMGGGISVESEPDRGSTFRFTVRAGAVQPTGANCCDAALEGRRLAVAEPNAAMREILVEMAAAWGMDACGIASAAELSARIARGGKFDAALVAFDSAELPAVEELIRTAAPTTKVLLMSSVAERPSGIERASIAGFISKPVRSSQLHAALARAFANTGPEPQSRSAPRFHANAAALNPLRILVAEDDRINQKVVAHTLKRLGYDAAIAGDGAEALDAVRNGAFDLVLMDVQMPVMDGLEATRRIRGALPPGRQPRIVAMTAAAFAEDRERCLAAGMDDYISKPVEIEDLAAALDRAPRPPR